MSALYLLSEAGHEPNLGWLLWIVLALFCLIVLIGWIVSNKKTDDLPAEPAPVVKTEEAPVLPDDLKKIEGIGPKVAVADTEVIKESRAAAKLHMMDPSGWIEQAELAAKGDWDALETLQDELKGGRRV